MLKDQESLTKAQKSNYNSLSTKKKKYHPTLRVTVK